MSSRIAARRIVMHLGLATLILATAASFAAQGKKGGKAGTGRKAKAQTEASASNGWISLFDGKSLDGWKANEVPGAWVVKDGTIMTSGGVRSHLFYDGPVQSHDFKNFNFKCDVMTTTGANSGLYFHTKLQPAGYPSTGFEAQVDSTHSDPKRTGSLYGIKDLVEPQGSTHSKDGKWFTYEISVDGKRIVLKIDGKTTVDYTEPDTAAPAPKRSGRKLASGTFALQAHPPAKPGQAGTVYFKNIMVQPLP